MPGAQGADAAGGYQPPRAICIRPTVMLSLHLISWQIPEEGFSEGTGSDMHFG